MLITLSRFNPFNALIFFQTSDGLVFELMDVVKRFHDSFLLFLIRNLAFALSLFSSIKLSEVLFFFKLFSVRFLFCTASFILSFHHGTLGFFDRLVVPIIFFCSVYY